jgi:hypothetical protein
MISRQMFAWLLHHLNEGRRGLTQPSIYTDYGHLYPVRSALHLAGGVPLFATYGDIHQLPVVGGNCPFENAPNELGTANAEGSIAFQNFTHPDYDSGTVGISVIMDETIHQSDPVFKVILQYFWDDTVTKTHAGIILKLPKSNTNAGLQCCLI